MHRIKWISILIVIFLSLTFLFPSQKAEDPDEEQTKKIIKKACKEDIVIDLSGLAEINEKLASLENLKDLKISINLDELFESLESLECLEKLKDLEKADHDAGPFKVSMPSKQTSYAYW